MVYLLTYLLTDLLTDLLTCLLTDLLTCFPGRFRLHRACQVSGLLVATAGVVLALVWFAPLDSTHGILGCVVTGLGWTNPINALVSP